MFALTAVLSLLSAVSAAECTRTATVVSGDTCNSLSTQYGVSTFQFALYNAPNVNNECDNLMPDQVVCLGQEGADCSKIYTVVAGDTCEQIQEMFGLDFDGLRRNNPTINNWCSNIYIGEVLCVDTTTYDWDFSLFNKTSYEEVAETYQPFCDEL